ncbi:DNA translocase FtsK 4TM domain-containing protein [Ectothiorhodospira magna]|uniref:DNA translocase FtsK 4TM domain-containing protein n=1 Tax=Ectothiorhodospira magna TaxID=867345 RepID=UPI000B7D8F83|nr:DNA translocase FtsK 4TM domain-containing protein [Ectothiorhodospira magna]
MKEGSLVVMMAVAAYLSVALASYSPADPAWSRTGTDMQVTNLGGAAGAWMADVLFYALGYLAYLVPVAVAYGGWLMFRDRPDGPILDLQGLLTWGMGFAVILAAGCGLAALHVLPGSLPLHGGGVLGELTSELLMPWLHLPGVTLVLLALLLIGITLFTGLSWLSLVDRLGHHILSGLERTLGWPGDDGEAHSEDTRNTSQGPSRVRIEPLIIDLPEPSEDLDRHPPTHPR